MAYKGPQVVVGPSSSTDNTIPRFDLTTGALLQGSSVVISDADAVSGITQLDVDNVQINGNTIASTDTNGDIVLAPDGTGVVSVTTAAIVPSGDRADSLGSATNSWDNLYCDGVSFDDGSNVLSAYETGTFTPAIAFGGGTTGITYAIQNGSYTRIGNIVFCRISIGLSSKGTDTGAATLTGLPFTCNSSHTFSVGRYSSFTFTASHISLSSTCVAATTTATLLQSQSGGTPTAATDTNFANNTQLFWVIFYEI